MKKQLLISLGILLILTLITVVVIIYGKGYRLDFSEGKPELAGTGLLVTTSNPDGAQVFIDGHLTTATDNTINLPPGEYTVSIRKEGYFPWEKRLKVQEEVVAKADALLFPTAPKLESITAIGVENPVIDPSRTRIAYTVASQSARKNGVYILDMNTRLILTLQSASTQIADDTIAPFSQAQLSWSPDGQELLATISGELGLSTTYLLQTNGFNQNPVDVTATLESVRLTWEEEKMEKDISRFNTLKQPLRTAIQSNFTILSWSPDETKILYEASQSAELPIIIKPRLIGFDTTPEQRTITQGNVYVYDIKEDKNYELNLDTIKLPENEGIVKEKAENTTKPLPIRWFPDSEHLIFINDKKIEIMEYDGTNKTTVYAGPFTDNYVFPWTNGSRIVILTNLGNPSIKPNLYTISLQ